ncbi:MAG TPA: tryptophan--tRNA ligase [Candidatus Paceibacterota bacterium]|jgi:tryptophanyl-tRNA synthetase|nr:tryptophan--tRNA ligase [Parcubacteria group bacterium]MDP6119690.1 tryptophan--tRNA ligase [Candidatus Paceibacterota bacterium]HJN62788.1 tryptophan--tRNA ligase [Candidatus Paceibacterota bacterium]|tara:strand:+ start:2967 stop:3926 length:960 start_codon:yes stop_codon:yes gene_type:complete
MAKRLLSGIQPSGELHVGNYLGALKRFVEMQGEYETFVFVANYHSLTTLKNAEEMKRNTIDVVKDYVAAGLDPEKVVLYTQTDVPEVTELAWIFGTLITMPNLMRAHAFKDAEARNKEINVGVFNYPVLMAADILVVDADVVPVGKDQQQHVEMARDIGNKFNNAFGDTFKIPEPLIDEGTSVIPGIDGQKMSKSYGNTISLFGSDEEIKAQVAKIVTDSKGVDEPKDPENDLVFAFHKLFSTNQLPELEKRYREGGLGHKESKDILADNIIKLISPMREKRESISDEDAVEILRKGAEKVRNIVAKKLEEVREKAGLI